MEKLVYISSKKYITTKAAAERSGYTSDYIGQLAREGWIISKKVGRSRYVEQESLDRYIHRLKENEGENLAGEPVHISIRHIDNVSIDDLPTDPAAPSTKTDHHALVHLGDEFAPARESTKDALYAHTDSLLPSREDRMKGLVIPPYRQQDVSSKSKTKIFSHKIAALLFAGLIVASPYIFSRAPKQLTEDSLTMRAFNEMALTIGEHGVAYLITDSLNQSTDLVARQIAGAGNAIFAGSARVSEHTRLALWPNGDADNASALAAVGGAESADPEGVFESLARSVYLSISGWGKRIAPEAFLTSDRAQEETSSNRRARTSEGMVVTPLSGGTTTIPAQEAESSP